MGASIVATIHRFLITSLVHTLLVIAQPVLLMRFSLDDAGAQMIGL